MVIAGGVGADLTHAKLCGSQLNALLVTHEVLPNASAKITLAGAVISGFGREDGATKDERCAIALEEDAHGVSRVGALPQAPRLTGKFALVPFTA